MKGYRFYAEYDSPQKKRKGEGNGNALAIDVESYTDGKYECRAAVYGHPDSATCTSMVNWEILRDNYRRITEAEARKLHPRLFAESF